MTATDVIAVCHTAPAKQARTGDLVAGSSSCRHSAEPIAMTVSLVDLLVRWQPLQPPCMRQVLQQQLPWRLAAVLTSGW
jgi:hypothetical protein